MSVSLTNRLAATLEMPTKQTNHDWGTTTPPKTITNSPLTMWIKWKWMGKQHWTGYGHKKRYDLEFRCVTTTTAVACYRTSRNCTTIMTIVTANQNNGYRQNMQALLLLFCIFSLHTFTVSIMVVSSLFYCHYNNAHTHTLTQRNRCALHGSGVQQRFNCTLPDVHQMLQTFLLAKFSEWSSLSPCILVCTNLFLCPPL